MAVLSDADRFALWARFMSDLSNDREIVGAFTKGDLRAAVNATDDWIEANQASFNAALPEPFRTEGTAVQKARLFHYVLRRRFEVG